MLHKLLTGLCILLVLAAIGIAAAKMNLLPGISQEEASALILPVSDCSPAAKTCTAQLPNGGQIEFSMSPRPIRPLERIDLQIFAQGIQLKRAEVDFSGVDMNMGYNRAILEHDKNGRYTGNAILPICITGKMMWKVTVLLQTDEQNFAVPFLMEVGS